MPRKELHDVSLAFHGETDKAIKVSESGKNAEAFWLPKSQIEWEMDPTDGMSCNVTIPTWLAKEKGLAGF